MTPRFLIEDAISAFGQFNGRFSQVEDDFWEVLWEVERILKPDENVRFQTINAVDNGSYLSYGFVEPPNVIDVLRVVEQGSGRELQRIELREFWVFPRFVPSGSVFAFRHFDEVLLINRDNSVNPPLVYDVSYFVFSDRVTVDTDVPSLERLFPVVRLGLLGRLAGKVKDVERFELFQRRYEQALGLMRERGDAGDSG